LHDAGNDLSGNVSTNNYSLFPNHLPGIHSRLYICEKGKSMKQTINLPIKNLIRHPARTIALSMLTLFLSFSALGGSLLVYGLQGGLKSLESKLGADIMVVPYEATTKSTFSDMILQGNPGYFYMSDSITEKLSNYDGIGQISTQFYLASTSSGCCDYKVQIIGYDPNTDFTITPWLKDNYSGGVGDFEIVVGNQLNAFPGDTLRFFDVTCTVVAKLDETGSYLDTAVYANMNTIRAMIQGAKDNGMHTFDSVDPDNLVSSVLINVADGYSVDEVLNDINIHNKKVSAVRTQNMLSDVSTGLLNISGIISVLLAAVWILALVILFIAFSMIGNERKKEFAILRGLGASQRTLSHIMLKEAFYVSLLGSLAGAVLASIVMILFQNLIRGSLDLPYLLPGTVIFIGLFIGSVAASILAGTLSSLICVSKVSHVDTAIVLRGDN
jgi:putative ABC transport system permease protein